MKIMRDRLGNELKVGDKLITNEAFEEITITKITEDGILETDIFDKLRLILGEDLFGRLRPMDQRIYRRVHEFNQENLLNSKWVKKVV